MAGIGFSLRKLFDKKGIFNLCRAYGYTGIISIGPDREQTIVRNK